MENCRVEVTYANGSKGMIRETFIIDKAINNAVVPIRLVEFVFKTYLNNFMGFFSSENIRETQNGIMIRWASFFATWKFKVENIKGTKNCVVDMLTREERCCHHDSTRFDKSLKT